MVFQELLNLKEEGYQKVQQAVDNCQETLQTTAVQGKETLREEIRSLQKDFDILISNANEAKV